MNPTVGEPLAEARAADLPLSDGELPAGGSDDGTAVLPSVRQPNMCEETDVEHDAEEIAHDTRRRPLFDRPPDDVDREEKAARLELIETLDTLLDVSHIAEGLGFEKALRLARSPKNHIGVGAMLDALIQERVAHERQGFRILSEQELSTLRDPEWLIAGVLPRNSLAQITGPPSSFKSFLALDMVCSIATGKSWCGRSVMGGPVLYIAAEGAEGMKRRVPAWKHVHSLRDEAIPVTFVTEPVILTDPGSVRRLILQLAKRQEQPVAIVIDTLARNFQGNENSVEDMSAYIQGCDRLRGALGATILNVHHTGWNDHERGRGSSSQAGALDTEIIVKRDGTRVRLTCRKQKDAEEFQAIEMELQRVGKSLVSIFSSSPGGTVLNVNERKALGALQSLPIVGGSAKEWRSRSGMVQSSFFAAQKRLTTRGYAIKEGRRYRLTDAGRVALHSSSEAAPSLL